MEYVWCITFPLRVKNIRNRTVTINVFLLKNEIVQSVLLYYFWYVQLFLLISYFSNGVGEQLSEESCGG